MRPAFKLLGTLTLAVLFTTTNQKDLRPYCGEELDVYFEGRGDVYDEEWYCVFDEDCFFPDEYCDINSDQCVVDESLYENDPCGDYNDDLNPQPEPPYYELRS